MFANFYIWKGAAKANSVNVANFEVEIWDNGPWDFGPLKFSDLTMVGFHLSLLSRLLATQLQ